MRSMLDRHGRGVPPSAGPDEETVRIARSDFRRRRFAGRRRTLRSLALLLLLLGAVAAGVWLVFFSRYVTADRVVVVGNASVGQLRVERAADVPTGTPLARVDLGAVRHRVEAIAAVRSADVSRSWPHTVRIDVTERTPVAVVETGQGLRSLDAQGVLFGGYAERPEGLPLVQTRAGTRREALAEAGRVVEALPAPLAGKVDRLEVASIDEIRLVLTNGRRVLWGTAQDSDRKAEVLAVLLKQKGNEIDVSVPGRPTTR